MTRKRSLTQLTLSHWRVLGEPGWINARWKRADGSEGRASVQFTLKNVGRWEVARVLIEKPTAALMRDVPLARIEQAVNASAKADKEMWDWLEQGGGQEWIKQQKQRAAKRPRLQRPASRRGLDDEFYELVAAAYRGAVIAGLPPSKTLAEDSDTPPGTVNRWIAESRRRGHLPPAEPGKVSA
jgi:hypothetical protein